MKQLVTIPLVRVGFSGLNKSQVTSSSLTPDWAVEMQNIVFDSANRIAARKGWTKAAASDISGTPEVQQVVEFSKADGTVELISAANNKLYKGSSSFTDITGSVTVTANNWQFVNFYDKLLGWQQGHAPVVWTGTGNFAAISVSAGSIPNGNCVCAAFGRVWALDSDGFTVKYCVLGDETDWGGAGSGSINTRQLWTRGTDAVVGIYAVGAKLLIFGSNHIIVIEDGSGSNLGLDPAQMVVADTLEGTGLAARDTVKSYTEGDLLYLSANGVQSFQRAVVQKDNPLASLDTHMRDYIKTYLSSETMAYVRSVFSPEERFYLLILPTAGRIFCYDTLYPMQDGRLRITEWVFSTDLPQCAVRRKGGSLYFGMKGNLGFYNGNQDNGTTYRYIFLTPYITGSSVIQQPPIEDKVKILKRINYTAFTTRTVSGIFKWSFDFTGVFNSAAVTLAGGNIPEYGTAEYGTNGVYDVNDSDAVAGVDYAEYGGTADLMLGRLPGSSAGRWFQLGIELDINGGSFALQELDAVTKIGRTG